MADRGPRQGREVEIGASNALQHHPQPHFAEGAHGYGRDAEGHHHRRERGDLEIGDTSVLRRRPTPHLAADHAPPVSEFRLRMEEKRPLWLRECLAEMTGVFCYTYAGIAATASLTLATAADEPAFGSLLTIGFACASITIRVSSLRVLTTRYMVDAIGIAFALITSATTSGGHCGLEPPRTAFLRLTCLPRPQSTPQSRYASQSTLASLGAKHPATSYSRYSAVF